MKCQFASFALMGLLVLAPSARSQAESTANRVIVDVDKTNDHLTVTIDGKTAFVYRYGDEVDLPHFDPFNSPSGRAMTAKIAEPYPHHRSFWVAEQNIQVAGVAGKTNIYDGLYSGVKDPKSKWPVAPYERRSEHVEFSNIQLKGDTAEFDEKLTWMKGQTPLLNELRHYRITALDSGEYFLDFSYKLCADYGKVTITRDVSHYATPYIRMNEAFNVSVGGGMIVNSEGGKLQAGTDLKPANWVDYSAPRPGGDEWEGLACFIHPSKNPPHLWLTRDYGTWGPRGPDKFHHTTFSIPKGESLDQRVGLLVHCGNVDSGQVAERYKAYGEGEL